MKLFLVSLFCWMFHFHGNGQVSDSCLPTINSKAAVFPNRIDSGFTCPPGTDCSSGIKAKDDRFEVVSFKLSGNKLCDVEGGTKEIVNIGAAFSGHSGYILSHACKGAVIEFTCIKAKTKDGMMFILQPFTITVE